MPAKLIGRCERLDLEARTIVIPAGDTAHSGRSATVGKIGLVGKAPLSATIEADMASILYVLNTPQFEAIKGRHPALSPRSWPNASPSPTA